MLAEALYLDFDRQMPAATRDFFRWMTFLVSTPVVFYAGWPFLAGHGANCARAARHGHADRHLGAAGLLRQPVETVRGGPHVWYDAAVMFVFLLLAARMLEQRARRRRQRPGRRPGARAPGVRHPRARRRHAANWSRSRRWRRRRRAGGGRRRGARRRRTARPHRLLRGIAAHRRIPAGARAAGEPAYAGTVCREAARTTAGHGHRPGDAPVAADPPGGERAVAAPAWRAWPTRRHRFVVAWLWSSRCWCTPAGGSTIRRAPSK
jgi:P-type Cu2+ transporter